MDPVQEAMQAELDAVEETFPTPGAQVDDGEFTPVPQESRDLVTEDIMKKFMITIDQIKAAGEKYMPLKIAGLEDKKGYDLVHSARMEVRDMRLTVDKRHKFAKADALVYSQKCDKVKNFLNGMIKPIEDHLDAEEERIDAERERIKAEKQREKDAELQRRIDALTAVGHPVTVGDLVTMPATTFAMVLQTATETWELKERERKAGEAALEAQRKAETERAERDAKEKAALEERQRKELAEQKARQEAEDKRLADAREALRKEQEAFEAKKRAQEQAARNEQIRKEAAERAKLEAEAKAAAEKAQQEQEAAQAEARKQAAAAARPDADKLLALAESLRGTAYPKLATAEGQKVITEAALLMAKLIKYVEDKANALSPRVTA